MTDLYLDLAMSPGTRAILCRDPVDREVVVSTRGKDWQRLVSGADNRARVGMNVSLSIMPPYVPFAAETACYWKSGAC